MDTILRGGTIVDGTGRKPYVADVAIQGDKIAKIGPNLPDTAKVEVDCAGKIVIPGLIDPHVHEEWICLVDGTYEMFLAQGVTTVVNGNCGHSIAPGPLQNVVEYYYGNGLMSREQRDRYAASWPEWEDFAGYKKAVEGKGTNLNLCTLLGHGTIRQTVMGGAVERPFTAEEKTKVEAIIRHNMEQGAWGISYGLDYVPGRYADTDELVWVASIIRDYDGTTAAHLRHALGVLEATQEFLEVGRRSGCKLQVSHLRPSCPEAFEAIREAADGGMRVRVDTIPASTAHCQSKSRALLFTASTSDELFSQGPEGVQRALRTKEGRALIAKDPYFIDRDQRTNILCMTDDPALEGRNVAEIAEELGMDPKEYLMDLLAGDQNFTLWSGGPTRSDFIMENHTEVIRSNPYVSAGSDEILGDPEDPYDWYELLRRGAMPAFIQGNLERGMPLEEVIRRNTSLVADHFGIEGRGRLEEGKYADIAVLDLENYRFPTVAEIDYRKPNTVASGVSEVLCNGAFTRRAGKSLPSFPGRVLTHEGGKA